MTHFFHSFVTICMISSTLSQQCEITKTTLNQYWTTDNILFPSGCIDRSNISLLYADHSYEHASFWVLPRNGARRACKQFGVSCAEQIYGSLSLANKLPLIASDVAGSTNHGYNSIYGIATSLEFDYTGLSELVNIGVEIYSFNKEIDYFESWGSLLFVGQQEYDAGYATCLQLKNRYGANKILIARPFWGFTREKGCNDAMENNTITVVCDPNNLDNAIHSVKQILIDNPDIDAIMMTNLEAEPSVHFILSNGTYTGHSYETIKGSVVFDYTTDILEKIRNDQISFAVSQQSYLQGYLPIYLLGIKAATNNAVLEPSIIHSGPQFVSTKEEAQLVECFTEEMYYCDDDKESLDKLGEGCECINTLNKTIYLLHHGIDNDNNFYSILTSGALQAANDINLDLTVINATLDEFATVWEDTIFSEHHNHAIEGIITTIPTNEISDLIARVINNEHRDNIEIFGIADGYNIYVEQLENIISKYDYRHTLYFGQNDEDCGYKMTQTLHSNYSTLYKVDNSAILCIDNRNMLLASHNERCNGVEKYCIQQGITYKKVLINGNDDAIYNAINELITENINISVSCIISSGEDETCLISQNFLDEYDGDRHIQLGCFDGSSSALNGLTNNKGIVSVIYDEQPWLIGYLSVLMMANRLFVDIIPAEYIITTGPKIITVFDANDIEIKRCEHQFNGYPLCPPLNHLNTTKMSQFIINYPSLSNFSGVIVLILFIITLLLSSTLSFLIYIWRHQAIIKHSQPIFVLITIWGGCIMMIAGLFYISHTGHLNEYICNVGWVIWSIGFTIFFCSYTVRVWRFVNLISSGLNLVQVTITKKQMLIRLLIVILIDIILNILAATVTPFKSLISQHNEIIINDNENTINEITSSQCSFNDSAIIWYISIGYKFIILFYAIIIALKKQLISDKLKKLKNMSFHEGSNMSVGIYIVLVSFAIFILFGVSLTSDNFNPSTQWILCSFLSFVCYVSVISCVMLHRIVYLVKKKLFANSMAAQMDIGSVSKTGSKQHEMSKSQSQSQSSQSDSSENDASSVYEKYQISFEFKAPKTKEFIHIKDEIKRNNIITDTKLWANENENEIECDDTIEYLFNNTIHKLHKMKGNNYMESMICPNIAKLGWRHGSYVPYIFGNHCEPWWARDAVYIMSKLLNKQMIGIEYGTGISSIWLSMLTKYVIAMEHDKIWQIGVNNITKKLNVNNLLVFQEHLGRRYCELDYSHSFDNNPGGYEWEKGKIDFFSMDGRLRYPATEWMLNWIKPHGGILLFDNSDRIEVGNKYGQHNATDLIPKHWLRYDSSYFKQHIDPIKDKRWLQNSMTSIWITRHEKCAKGTQNFGINDYNDDNDLNFKPF
eukprot:355088_1